MAYTNETFYARDFVEDMLAGTFAPMPFAFQPYWTDPSELPALVVAEAEADETTLKLVQPEGVDRSSIHANYGRVAHHVDFVQITPSLPTEGVAKLVRDDSVLSVRYDFYNDATIVARVVDGGDVNVSPMNHGTTKNEAIYLNRANRILANVAKIALSSDASK